MERDYYVFLDAESDGLYGKFISAALVVVDSKGQEIERMYIGLSDDDLINLKDQWTKEHVIPVMGEYQPVENEQDLLNKVWNFWLRYHEKAYMIVDVCYPVEARLLQECVMRDVDNRAGVAPYPLLDLASILYTVGINPEVNREELLQGYDVGQQHNALYDVMISISIWKKYIWEIKNEIN